jgi:hypothetical protein
MPAEADQQIFAGGEHPVDVNSGNRTTGTDGFLSANAEGDCREMIPFTETSGGQTYEAGIPALAGDDKVAGHGPRLAPGMTLAVEPMVNQGRREIRVMRDGWTVRTADGSLAAHYENSILITRGDPEILTVPGDLKI